VETTGLGRQPDLVTRADK